MGVRHRAAAVAALVLAGVGGVSRGAVAQSLYAAGAVGADISLVSGQESIPFAISPGGEAFSGAARLGTVLNDRFGIELEVSRAGETRNSSRSGGPIPLGAAFPIFLSDINVRTRITTISTTASIRQQVADNVALVYLGGVVFHRTDSEIRYPFVRSGIVDLPPRPLPTGFDVLIENAAFAAPFIVPSVVESIQYGAGPVVDFEAHIGYGDHLTIIPGVRMHSLPASWLLRPSVGAGWKF